MKDEFYLKMELMINYVNIILLILQKLILKIIVVYIICRWINYNGGEDLVINM